jgi:hypothetical protein
VIKKQRITEISEKIMAHFREHAGLSISPSELQSCFGNPDEWVVYRDEVFEYLIVEKSWVDPKDDFLYLSDQGKEYINI